MLNIDPINNLQNSHRNSCYINHESCQDLASSCRDRQDSHRNSCKNLAIQSMILISICIILQSCGLQLLPRSYKNLVKFFKESVSVFWQDPEKNLAGSCMIMHNPDKNLAGSYQQSGRNLWRNLQSSMQQSWEGCCQDFR